MGFSSKDIIDRMNVPQFLWQITFIRVTLGRFKLMIQRNYRNTKQLFTKNRDVDDIDEDLSRSLAFEALCDDF